ncbi:MAG: rRNA maturation RNase YbeY [Acidobacteriia bacterium]|nr:rRNA maturation RNase YbeY [Terriglobia bacterium]
MNIHNLQTSIRVNQRALTLFAKRAARATRQAPDDFSVVLVNDRTIQALNRRFLGRNRATDVLSFATGNSLAPWNAMERHEILRRGEIVISVSTAQRQARREGHSLFKELEMLIIHGMLHLMGYDHEVDHGQMTRKELALRDKLL